MIMEDDHDLDLQIFRNNPNCNWEVSSSYKLQLPSAAPSIPISPAALSIPSSPSPQLPKSQVREAVEALVPLVPAGAAPAAWSPLFYTAPQGQQGVRYCAPQAC